MTVIYIICLIFTLIVIAFTLRSLGKIEMSKKIVLIIVGLIICLIITSILFKISSSKLNYNNYNNDIYKQVRNVIILIFTPVNGLLIMPFVARQISNNSQNEDDKIKNNRAPVKYILFVVLIVIAIIFEIKYMTNTQEGIIQILNNLIESK